MELYQLDFFRILCKHGNFTSASDELNVTQPAVSTAVKKLEEELGKPLIDRNDKGFALTRAGEIVLGHAVNIHNEISAMGSELDSGSLRTKETIRFAAPFTMCPEFLISDLINDFMVTHMDITLNVFQKGHAAIVEGLANHSLEIGIFSKDMVSPILDCRDFISVELVAAFSADHRFNEAEKITPQMMDGETLILSKVSNRVPGYIRGYFEKNNSSPEVKYFKVIPPECVRLAGQGKGIAFVPERIAGDHYAHMDPPLICDLVVGWNKREMPTREMMTLVDYICGHEAARADN